MGAIPWMRALMGFAAFGIVWWVGNVLLYSSGGIATITENMQPAWGSEMRQGVFVFWNIVLPILVLVSLAVYMIVINQREAPS